MFLPIIAAGCTGEAMSKRGVRTWLCWAAAIVVLVVGFMMLWPAKEMLDSANCRDADDYEMCMEGGYDDY
jgi:putative Ca2+/H+ antiporter (TMEM165/GDT1 family)